MKTKVWVLLCVCQVLPLCAIADDYAFLWWANGWRGRTDTWQKTLHIQTSHYGAAIDVEKPAVTHLGIINEPNPYAVAVAEDNDRLLTCPPADLCLSIGVNGTRYQCKSAAHNQNDEANFPVRILESGRVVQRADILNLIFTDSQNNRLNGESRLEIVAESTELRFILLYTPMHDLQKVDVSVAITQDGKIHAGKQQYESLLTGTQGAACAVWSPIHDGASTNGLPIEVKTLREGDPIPVAWDDLRGWNYVDLPEAQWSIADEPNRLDRYGLTITNPTLTAKTCRLLMAYDKNPFQGITGMCPNLRDAQGYPTGIPVQISKNWHRNPQRPFSNEGPWFHAYAEVPIEPGKTWEGELTIAYARWGGVPAASHAQLCLVGWGVNQLWDQAAIGSWGESITYDPDVNLNRSMIDDIRPLMVTGMNGGQWEWTCNVGGGDFLVYCDDKGKRQYLTRMKTAYLSQGPNLTKVIYAGITADQKIAARIEVSTPRCDDVNRAYHTIRYDVLQDAPYSRMAFYQLGADHYNDHAFTHIAYGNCDGLKEEWATEKGGAKYLRTGIEGTGQAPWVSLHGGEKNRHHPNGAWANRGLVVRSWKARINGKEIAYPSWAVYGTEDGITSANMELSPPASSCQLLKGDYIEAALELLIIPQNASDYYGPNQKVKEDLEINANTWRPVHRLANGNNIVLDVQRGTLLNSYPPVLKAAENDDAQFTMRGGVGYMPIAIAGLSDYRGYQLFQDEVIVDQSVWGKDYWQSEYDADTRKWTIIYNVLLDVNKGENALHQFRLRKEIPGKK